MMEMTKLYPRTCQMCYGTGVAKWFMDDDTYEVRECECQYEEESNG